VTARVVKPCGTIAAYQRHLKRGEKPCDECKKANRDDGRQRRGNPKPLRDVGPRADVRGAPVRRARYAELRRDGLSMYEAAAAVGVDPDTGKRYERWMKVTP
jgi:hypothetical protein